MDDGSAAVRVVVSIAAAVTTPLVMYPDLTVFPNPLNTNRVCMHGKVSISPHTTCIF